MRRIKLKIAKFNKAIAMQILELIGDFKPSEHIEFDTASSLILHDSKIILNTTYDDISLKYFHDNVERDTYVNKIVNWVTTEQFNSNIEVKPGDLCYASDDSVTWHEVIYISKLPKEIIKSPKHVITHNTITGALEYVTYVKLTDSDIYPNIKNEVYTWEI